jgi:magnesium-protoporphyrin IX monomethyl ester (oxidative) cyclase
MYKIALVNMPLGNLHLPSVALTQLRAVARKRFGERVSVDVHYLNQQFALYLGLPAYTELNSFAHHSSGLGEWFFREVAFPGAPDTSDEYFQRYYPQHDPRNRMLKAAVDQKRSGLARFFGQMIDRHGLDRVDMVGFTSMFSQNVATIAMARLIKARNPDVVVLMGGANCEAPMGRVLADNLDVVDFVFSGPALKSFPELIRCRMEGDEAGCHRIDGVFSRRNRVQPSGCSSGELVAMGSLDAVRPFGDELDINEPVELDYDGFVDDYETNFPGAQQPSLMFETSRGCWWGERVHCTFCGLNGTTMSYRSMKPELAFSVLNSLFQYAGRCTHLQSVDNILPKSYLTDVLPLLDTPPTMELFYEVKADLTEEDFRVLARARVLSIQPGIEALNTSTLKRMRKGTSVFQNLQFLINSVRYGIYPAWNLLIGFPGEEMEVYEKYLADMPLLYHLTPPGGVHPVRFDRFSPYFDEAEAYGLQLRPLDYYPMTYPFAPEVLAELAYYFADTNYRAQYQVNVGRMVGRLREKYDRWASLWARHEHRPRLHLSERGGAATVYDSRSGTAVEYPIAEAPRLLLAALGTPKKLAQLQKELDGVRVEAELAWLRERGLVFHEGERFLSLVVPPAKPVSVLLEALRLTATV